MSGFLFQKLDTDGDGKPSRAEYNAGFDVIDADKDGFITRKESGAVSLAPFKLLDKGGDGKLFRTEYEAGFDLFDHDGDGFISRDEFNGAVGMTFNFDDY